MKQPSGNHHRKRLCSSFTNVVLDPALRSSNLLMLPSVSDINFGLSPSLQCRRFRSAVKVGGLNEVSNVPSALLSCAWTSESGTSLGCHGTPRGILRSKFGDCANRGVKRPLITAYVSSANNALVGE